MGDWSAGAIGFHRFLLILPFQGISQKDQAFAQVGMLRHLVTCELGLLGRRWHILGMGLLCSCLLGTGWKPCYRFFADAFEHSVKNPGLSWWWRSVAPRDQLP